MPQNHEFRVTATGQFPQPAALSSSTRKPCIRMSLLQHAEALAQWQVDSSPIDDEKPELFALSAFARPDRRESRRGEPGFSPIFQADNEPRGGSGPPRRLGSASSRGVVLTRPAGGFCLGENLERTIRRAILHLLSWPWLAAKRGDCLGPVGACESDGVATSWLRATKRSSRLPESRLPYAARGFSVTKVTP